MFNSLLACLTVIFFFKIQFPNANPTLELVVSLASNESLVPQTLLRALRKLIVQLGVSISVHTGGNGRAIRVPLISKVELVLLVRVGLGLGGHLDEAGGARLADCEIEDEAHGLEVEDVAGVDEGRGCGARGEVGPCEEGLLDADKGADEVDVETFLESLGVQGAEGVSGRAKVGLGGIVDNDSGNAKLGLDLVKGTDNRSRVGKVSLDVEQLVGAVLLADAPGDEGNFVSLLSEDMAKSLADVGTGAEDEGNGSNHCAEGCLQRWWWWWWW
jgi:hypothetical protein